MSLAVAMAGILALTGLGCTPFRAALAADPPVLPAADEPPPPTVPDSTFSRPEPSVAARAEHHPGPVRRSTGRSPAGVLNGWT
ncbi:MAG: hypothetical protein U0871_05035 [Gemmataceae bacterium]